MKSSRVMNMIGVIAAAAQPHRPTAVEAPFAAIAPPQWIGATACNLKIAADWRGKAAEQRPNDRVRAAQQIWEVSVPWRRD